MNTDEAITMFGAIILFGIIIAGAIGWILNIVAIANTTAFSGLVVIRAIGVFLAPLGAVLGYV